MTAWTITTTPSATQAHLQRTNTLRHHKGLASAIGREGGLLRLSRAEEQGPDESRAEKWELGILLHNSGVRKGKGLPV